MKKAYLKELFSGIQGEGPWIGYRQIFLRFLGCDLRCQWCDTPDSLQIKKEIYFSHESKPGQRDFENLINPISLEELCKLLVNFDNTVNHHSLSLTGGEPLLQTDFIKALLFQLKIKCKFKPKIYLETGGHKPKELAQIIDFIDFISYDLKLPSSTSEKPLWDAHEEFIQTTSNKQAYAKAVLTAETTMDDLKKVCNLLKNFNSELVLQPAYEISNKINYKSPNAWQMLDFQELAIKTLGPERVRVIPQTHKFIGQL